MVFKEKINGNSKFGFNLKEDNLLNTLIFLFMILILKNDNQSCVRKYRCSNDQKVVWTSFLKLLLYTYSVYSFCVFSNSIFSIFFFLWIWDCYYKKTRRKESKLFSRTESKYHRENQRKNSHLFCFLKKCKNMLSLSKGIDFKTLLLKKN